MNPYGPMGGPVDPGDANVIMATQLFNAHTTKPLTIISGEFEALNGKVLKPGSELVVNLNIPSGFREYINETNFAGKNYLYVGLRDKDQAEPMVHFPTL